MSAGEPYIKPRTKCAARPSSGIASSAGYIKPRTKCSPRPSSGIASSAGTLQAQRPPDWVSPDGMTETWFHDSFASSTITSGPEALAIRAKALAMAGKLDKRLSRQRAKWAKSVDKSRTSSAAAAGAAAGLPPQKDFQAASVPPPPQGRCTGSNPTGITCEWNSINYIQLL